MQSIAVGSTCSNLLKQIAPDGPNIDNYSEFENYNRIYEKNIVLNDRSIDAVVMETKDDMEYLFFLYGNSLISIKAHTGVITAEWLENLSFSLCQME